MTEAEECKHQWLEAGDLATGSVVTWCELCGVLRVTRRDGSHRDYMHRSKMSRETKGNTSTPEGG